MKISQFDFTIASDYSRLALDAVALTKELIRIPSVNPPGGEEPCARFLVEVLQAAGFKVDLHRFGEGRFNVVAELKGSGAGHPIGFTGHIDTVPLGNAAWEHEPFSAHESEGRIYGRGASDMKAGIAAFIAACAGAREAIAQTAGVQIILTGGEETGCDGAKALALQAPDLIKKLSLLIVGEPTANYPFVGHKGALWMRGTARGLTAHGAMPEQGSNAIYKAISAIDKLKLFKVGEDRHPLMGGSTLNVGRIAGGLNVNSVPDRTEFEFDIRTVPGTEHSCLCERLAQYFASEIELDVMVDVPSLSTEVDHFAIRQIFALCTPFHPEPLEYRAVPYFTDGSVLVPLTGQPPTVILGPGEPLQAHKTNEYCDVKRIDEAVELYRLILLDPLLSRAA
jgi:succinyl-diaminopimelate desuccinylase